MSQRNQKPITNFFNSSKQKAPTRKTNTSRNKNKDHNVKTEVNIKEEDDILLKTFDLNWVFGPCSGLPRLDRWERASKFSLQPPQEVKDLILKNSKNTLYTTCANCTKQMKKNFKDMQKLGDYSPNYIFGIKTPY